MKTSSWSSFCIKSGVNPANGLAATGDWGQDPSVAVSPGKPHVAQLATGPRKSLPRWAVPLCKWCPRFARPASGHSRKFR